MNERLDHTDASAQNSAPDATFTSPAPTTAPDATAKAAAPATAPDATEAPDTSETPDAPAAPAPKHSALYECGPSSPALITHAKATAKLRARLAGPSTVKPGAMLFVLMFSTFSGSFSQSMMNIALPHVASHFEVTLSMANWIVVGYTIVAATAITMAASLLARYGLREVFTFSCACLALGSAVGMLALNFEMLVASRLIQAIATGILFPVVTGAIALLVSPEKRGTTLALNSGIIGVGQATGPLVSGYLLTTFNLHVMFLPPTVLGIVLIVLGLCILRNVEDRVHRPIDLLSVVLSFVGLAAFMYGLGEITHQPLPAEIGLIVGAAIIAAFIVRQLKIAHPLLSLKPLANPAFTIGVILVMLGMMATASMSLLLPLFYEGAAGDTAFLAGSMISAPLILYALCSIAGGKIFDRRGIWPLVPVGFALILCGFIGVFVTSDERLILAVFGLSFLIYGGVGFVVAPSKTKALNELDHDLYSHGAAINSVFVQVANAFGASLFVGVLSADVVHGTAAGMTRADAYAAGFAHTLIISLVLCSISLIVALIYSYKEREKIHH